MSGETNKSARKANGTPRVSVLIPYYNDSAFLAEAIESVLAQTYADFELVLVNHASIDGSRDIARRYDDPRLVHVDLPVNNGAGGGLIIEAFLRVARGEFVKFFCADDILAADGLGRLVSALETHPECDLAFGDMRYVDVGGRPVGKTWYDERPGFSRTLDERACLRQMADGFSVLPWCGSMVRRRALDGLRFDATMVMMFDMTVWLQLLLRGSRFVLTPDVVSDYRLHDGQVSSVTHRNEMVRISIFEHQVYRRFLMESGNVDLVKAAYPGSVMLAKVTSPDDLPLGVALHHLTTEACAFWAYQVVHDRLETAEGRARAAEVFGFTVADFRRLLRTSPVKERKRVRRGPFRRFWRWLRGREDLSL